ncbi:transcriptional regulator with XRE-family HTH domain [Agrobacterium vitis]|nr:transcriptional regulator with XRE-family HTH domain [Agrobacterium vitis]MBE1438436.1 transcriptional regulator with XRE-family HTH domain [Agrobacterium vitis]
MRRFDIKGLLGISRESFGDRLCIVRDSAGMDLSDLAVAADISESTIRAWEAGNDQIDNQSLVRMADVLGVSPGWLLTGEGVGPQPQSADTDMINFMRWELERLTRMHQETAAMIDALHRQIGDLERNPAV